MKIIASSIALIFLTMLGCSDVGSPTDLNTQNPLWLAQLIIQFQNAPVGNPPQSIWRYQFNGHTVYYIPPQCCDQFSVLYDSSGNTLCAPGGGFGGIGDGRCPDFWRERTEEALIWRDSRNK